MSFAINVRDVGTAEVIGTSLSPENSNTVIGLIKRIYTLLSNFVTRVTNLTTRVDNIAETVEDLSSLGENQGSSLLGLVEQVNSNGTRITNLENTNQTINSNINSNTIRISTLEGADNEIRGQVSSLDSQISYNLDKILDNTGRIISLENTTSLNSSNINDLQTNVASNTNRISALESADQTLNSNINSNTNRISALESADSTNSSNISTLQSVVNTNSTNITQIQKNLKKYIYYCDRPSCRAFSFITIGGVYFSWWNTTTNTEVGRHLYSTPIEIKYLEGINPNYWVSSNNVTYYPYRLSFKRALGGVDTGANPYNFLEWVGIMLRKPDNSADYWQLFRIPPYYNTNLDNSNYYGQLPAVILKRGELVRWAQTRSSNYQGSVRFWIRDTNDFNFTPSESDVVQIIDGEFWSDIDPDTLNSSTILTYDP